MLSVSLNVSEPATVTIKVLNKRGKAVAETVVVRSTAGAFSVKISLKAGSFGCPPPQRRCTRLPPGQYTLRVTATDARGLVGTTQQAFLLKP